MFEVEGKAAEGLARAEERVRTGPVTDLFTAHRILLVTKLEGRRSTSASSFKGTVGAQ